jgi:putative FmdB family regulatory protein
MRGKIFCRLCCGKEFGLPLYEYECGKCAHRFEKIENVSASPTKKCPKCGGKAERLFAAPAIQFKGSGWYVSDYGGKGAGAAAGEKSEEKSADKSTEKSTAASDGDSSSKKPSASKEKETKPKKD